MQSKLAAMGRGVPGLVMGAVVVGVLAGSAPAFADSGEVNLYSSRNPSLTKPLLDAFTEATGVKVNVAFMNKGMLERLKAEGVNSPADAILTTDISNLDNHARAGLLQAITSPSLEENIPAQYRDPGGLWFGLTTRARVIFAHKERVKPGEVDSYEDLAAPHMKGRVCTRSGKHVYNISLLASIIAARGEAAAEAWAKGVKANLARRPQGNDRAQVKAVMEGECDVSLGNTYYMGLMATNEKQPEQKEWAAAVRVVFPNQSDRGTHVNVSGAAVVQGAWNKENAIRLIEFLAGAEAQAIYARANFEYPVKPGVPVLPLVASWGEFEPDDEYLSEIARHRVAATKIMDRVRFDQ